jgi:hypothetical protein
MTFEIKARCSSLTEIPDCERRWAARHAQELLSAAGFQVRQMPGQIGAKVGTGTHSGVAHMLQRKIDTGELSSRQDAEEIGIESLRAELAEGAVFDDTTPTMNTAERQVQRMVAVYHVVIAPTVKPVAVEQALEARYNPRITLTGHLDLAEDNVVDDLKTGVLQRPNHPQYGGYSLLRRSHGHPVTNINEHYVPRNSIDRPQRQPVITPYPVATSEKAARAVLARIDSGLQGFLQDGDPWHWIPNPASMLCSDRFCPAHGTAFCQAHRSK